MHRAGNDDFYTTLALAGYLSTSLQGVAVVIDTLDYPKATDESELYLIVMGEATGELSRLIDAEGVFL